MTKNEKVKAVAIAFMADDPEQYVGMTVDELCKELEQTSDDFIDTSYQLFVANLKQ